MSTSKSGSKKLGLTRLLAVAIFALLAIGATVAVASGTPIGLTSAFTGGSAIGLNGSESARHHIPASLTDRKRVAISYRRHHHRPPPASPAPGEPGAPTVPPAPPVPAVPGTDTTAPQTSIGTAPDPSDTATAASFTFASSESGSTFTCKLDSGNWAACTSPKAYSGLSVDSHSFSVRATDTAGNTDAIPATWSWTVESPEDTTAPQTSVAVASGPAATGTATTASFTFISSESGSTFACRLDSGSWTTCTSPKSYSGVSVGSRRFSVRASDASGNVDATPATYDWTVEGTAPPADTVPPNTSITSGPPEATTSSAANFTFASTESGSTFECQLDGGAWIACTPPQAYDSVPVGEHEFLVRASDPADNVDRTPATADWTVESQTQPPPATGCTTTTSSVAAAQSAISSAASGAVVCLANGSYGKVSLDASKSAPGVTLRAANAAGATIAGASLDGSNLTLTGFISTNSIQIQPGASGMTIEHNRVTGGGQGIDAGPTSTTTINDTRIVGNELIGPFGEDAIHLNRYHDGNGDGIGILIEGNEITNVRENGNHSDCLQTVWVGDHIVFRKNYIHDNRCQGFFVKDQASLGGVSGPIAGIAVEDNLFVRNREPCAPEAPGCGQPIYMQVFGPYSGFTMKRNTIWGDGVDSIAAFREGTGADTQIANNVIYRLWTDTNMSAATLTNNTVCKRETGSGGSWPAARTGETTACTLSFQNPAADDYRISGSDRGIDWAPAEQHFGP